LQSALRAFELLLLREIGLLPLLDAQTMTLLDLDPQARYSLVPEVACVKRMRRIGPASAVRNGSLCNSRWVTVRRSPRPCAPARSDGRAQTQLARC